MGLLAYIVLAEGPVEIADAALEAHERVAQLDRIAARGDMREFVVRAALHRAGLGDPSGLAAARLLGETIDHAALHAEFSAAA